MQYNNVYCVLFLHFFPTGFFGVLRHGYTDNYPRGSVEKPGQPGGVAAAACKTHGPAPPVSPLLLSGYLSLVHLPPI